MLTSILAFVLKFLSGPTVEKALAVITAKAQSGDQSERVRADVTIETVRAAVQQGQQLADLNRAKLDHVWFWALLSLFVVPLGVWWAAVLADSIFHFPFDIADLPNAHMREWAGDMITWLFYVGTGVGAAKMVFR